MDLNSLLLGTSSDFVNISGLILRIFIGVCFVIHGMGKLGLVGPGSMAGFVGWLESLGVPFSHVQARMAMLSEVGGGALMTLGLFTRVGALLCLGTMIVATLIGHRGGGYLITNNPPGNEYTINLSATLVVIILLGPGAYSLDALLF
ncbi:MAG: DoxX family protein [Pseudobdellovibrionaceae bacterium]